MVFIIYGKNDAEKLRSLGVTDKDCSHINTDAENADCFTARLDRLQPVQDDIVPVVHHWAIRGVGKCQLAPEFLKFFVETPLWVQWSGERNNQHYEALLRHYAVFHKCWNIQVKNLLIKKPGNSGKNIRRARLPEPELSIERVNIEDLRKSSFKVKKNMET